MRTLLPDTVYKPTKTLVQVVLKREVTLPNMSEAKSWLGSLLALLCWLFLAPARIAVSLFVRLWSRLRTTDGSTFAINDSLLAGGANDATGGWRNLGLWMRDSADVATDAAGGREATTATLYRAASERLALTVGAAARLGSGDRVLDLACGRGASLRLWGKAFGVTRLAAMELQPACAREAARVLSELPLPAREGGSSRDAVARGDADQALRCAVVGRFDCGWLPAPLRPHSFDAVVCVDAAYHALSLGAFLDTCVAALARGGGGRVAFTTLAVNPLRAPLPLVVRVLLKAAAVPVASVLSPEDIERTMAARGFRDVRIDILDDRVFGGFAAHVERRASELPQWERLSADWGKIRVTGAACAALSRRPFIHYVIASGRLS